MEKYLKDQGILNGLGLSDLDWVIAEVFYSERLSGMFRSRSLQPDDELTRFDLDVSDELGRNRNIHHLYQYNTQGISARTIPDVLAGVSSDRRLAWRVEGFFRLLALRTRTQREREIVAVGWCLSFAAVAGRSWLGSVKAPFFNLFGLDDVGDRCSHGSDILRAYCRNIRMNCFGDEAWVEFMEKVCAVTEKYYGELSWLPPRHCFAHTVCSRLPCYPPLGRCGDENEPDVAFMGSSLLWRDCFPNCVCDKHYLEGFEDAKTLSDFFNECETVVQARGRKRRKVV